MATRIHVLLARAADVGVIFRRGPTKQVRLLRWDLRTDEVEGGQWLAGRVYTERCDLSPSGELLVYFGMRKGHTWTAVSRPPYFTPLAVWEESGTWGGGGRFVSDRRLLLRSNPQCMALQPEFELPRGFEVHWTGTESLVPGPGDWTARAPEADETHAPSGKPRPPGPWSPAIHCRVRPGHDSTVLEAHPVVVDDPYGPFHASEYLLRDPKKDRVEALGELDWADWARNGDLLYARDGDVLRAKAPWRREEATVVARLADDHFAAMPPPPEARRWPASSQGKSKRSLRRRG